MAEGLFRHEGGDYLEVFSAGTQPARVRLEAIGVLKEIGIDISGHRSKSVNEFAEQYFDYVVTVCDNARQSCPVFFDATKRIHWSIEDPALEEGPEDVRLAAFRKIRDEIHGRIIEFLKGFSHSGGHIQEGN